MSDLADAILLGNIADRPTDNAANTEGRLYFATDEGQHYRDNGVGWDTAPYYRDLSKSVIQFADNARVANGTGPLVTTIDAAQRYNFYAEMTAVADLDEWEWDITVTAGYYDLLFYCQKGPDCGIVEVRYNDDGPMTTFDLYDAAPTADVLFTFNHYKYVSGRTIVKFKVNGKNGSSSDFRAPFTFFALRAA